MITRWTVAMALFACLTARVVHGEPPSQPDDVASASLPLNLVKAGIDLKWKVVSVQEQALPPGWRSDRRQATVIQLSDGKARVTLSFVPQDWVGIQFRDDPKQRLISVFGVRRKKAFIVISTGAMNDYRWRPDFSKLDKALSNAKPANWRNGPNPRADEAERAASSLIKMHCANDAQRWDAILSLIRLDIPAPSLYRDMAIHGPRQHQRFAISKLRQFPGDETITTLRHVLTDPDIPPDPSSADVRKSAVYSLRWLKVKDHGKDLLTAFKRSTSNETCGVIADEFNRLRYAPAANELRRRLRAPKVNWYYKPAMARALATLRAPGAAEAIQAALDGSGKVGDRDALRTELLRLKGTWGQAVQDARMTAMLIDRRTLHVYVENMGDKPWRYLQFKHKGVGVWPMTLVVRVDDKVISPPDPQLISINGRIPSVYSGHAKRFVFEIDRHLPSNDRFVVTVTWNGLSAPPIQVSEKGR